MQENTSQEKVPNIERPPADWQVSDPKKYPDQDAPGIREPQPEIKNPPEREPNQRRESSARHLDIRLSKTLLLRKYH